VIPDRVVDLPVQFLLCLLIELKEHVRPLKVLLADIEDLISSSNTKICIRRIDLSETPCASGDG
jgi:hypothetical protein